MGLGLMGRGLMGLVYRTGNRLQSVKKPVLMTFTCNPESVVNQLVRHLNFPLGLCIEPRKSHWVFCRTQRPGAELVREQSPAKSITWWCKYGCLTLSITYAIYDTINYIIVGQVVCLAPSA